jgi:ornithine cyclodeaminase
MGFLALTESDVQRLLPLTECMDVMAEALAGLTRDELHQPLRMVVRPPGSTDLMGLMPSHRTLPQAAYGLKVVCIFPGNPGRGLDTHQGAVILFDGETGEVRALANASAVTAIRTAAVSGLATKLLARPDARRLALIGAGVQARWHLAAMATVRELERTLVWSRRAESARAFAEEAAARYSFPVEVAETAEAALRDSDLIVTATSAREPVVKREWLAEGAHINAVGACFPTTRELDTATVAAASFYVDRRESALTEAGDYVIAAHEGAIGPAHIRAELGEVVVGRAEGRTAGDELTVFESLGIAVEDLAAVEHVYRRALEIGAGTQVPF